MRIKRNFVKHLNILDKQIVAAGKPCLTEDKKYFDNKTRIIM